MDLLLRRRQMMAQVNSTPIGFLATKFSFTWVSNVYINENDGQEVAYNSWHATPFLPIEGATLVAAINVDSVEKNDYRGFYDQNYQYLGRGTNVNAGIVPPGGAVYVRLSFGGNSPAIIAINSEEVITPSVFATDSYIDPDNGTIVSYSDWSVYKVVIGEDVIGFGSTSSSIYNACYGSDDSFIGRFSAPYGNNLIGADYVMFSNKSNKTLYVYPIKKEESI